MGLINTYSTLRTQKHTRKTAAATGAALQVAQFEAIRANPNDAQVIGLLSQGYHIQAQTPEMIQLAKGKRVNHLLHAALSVLTVGCWLPVWLVLAMAGGEHRVVLTRTPDAPVLGWGQQTG